MEPARDKPLCPPERPPRFADVVYARVALDDGTPFELKLDIYQDPRQSALGPCVVYFFGGGWTWGDYKQTTQKAVYCRDLVRLTQRGLTVVCPDYRRANQAVFPACIHDCKGAIRFLKANGHRFNIDPERIGVLGNSSGGHLAAMVALSANCPEMEGDVGGNLEFSSAVKAACVFYAPGFLVDSLVRAARHAAPRELAGTEIENVGNDKAGILPALVVGYTGPGRTIQKLAQAALTRDADSPERPFVELLERCSPAAYASPNCPPIAVFQGGQDDIVSPDESYKLYQALTAAGADATYVAYSRGGHGPSLGEKIDRFAYEFLLERL